MCKQIEELARSFKEMNRTASAESAPSAESQPVAGGSSAAGKHLLVIQKKNLNPSFEMKRMFGSKVVQTKQ